MSTPVLVFILVVAIIISVGFLLLVFSLVPAINELKYLLSDLQKTSVEARELVLNLNEYRYKSQPGRELLCRSVCDVFAIGRIPPIIRVFVRILSVTRLCSLPHTSFIYNQSCSIRGMHARGS